MGFVNAEAARKRRPNFQGLNPCANLGSGYYLTVQEILLDNRGVDYMPHVKNSPNIQGYIATCLYSASYYTQEYVIWLTVKAEMLTPC